MTEMLSALVADCVGLPESVTFTVIFEVPAAVGVPVIAPVLAFKASPLGRLPAAMLQVTAPFPPVDCKVAVYADDVELAHGKMFSEPRS